MKIERRSLPMYMFLNCLTLGVYGFIVSQKIGKEVNAICKGDGEEPNFGYSGAILIRGISPILGIIFGFVACLIAFSKINPYLSWIEGSTSLKVVCIFIGMAVYGLLFSVIGSTISGIYLNYWWYKQANRLKFNAGRYGMEVKEGGLDNFLFRTVIDLMFLPITIALYVLSLLLPIVILWLCTLSGSNGAYVFASILLFIFSLPLMFFGGELTVGANFAMFFMFKNLNRFAKVVQNGALPFDPMGYEYYPSCENKYPNFVPNLVNGVAAMPKSGQSEEHAKESEDESVTLLGSVGNLLGEKGSCAGYCFELVSGEEVIIGKDAKMSSVVIDPAYKEVSRKHVGICYDSLTRRYRITDYSSNGTWVNGEKLTQGVPVYVENNSEIKLANGKNVFRVG